MLSLSVVLLFEIS